MIKYEATGRIIVIKDTETFSSGFTKREFVIETSDGKCPQTIPMQFVKDSCVKLDSFNVGDEVNVAFDIRGNESKGRYFVNLSAWKIDRIGAPAGVTSPEYGQPEQRSASQGGAKPPANVPEDDGMDEIPF